MIVPPTIYSPIVKVLSLVIIIVHVLNVNFQVVPLILIFLYKKYLPLYTGRLSARQFAKVRGGACW